jgi:hypothetical protein
VLDDFAKPSYRRGLDFFLGSQAIVGVNGVPFGIEGMCRQGILSLQQSAGTRFIKMHSPQGRGTPVLPWFMQVGESSKINRGLQRALGECRYPPFSIAAVSWRE